MLTRGSPRNPHLVFLHGLFGRKEDWLPLFQELQGEYYCIAIDLPQASVVEGVRAQLSSLSPQMVIGYSMGGRIALQLQEYKRILISSHLGLDIQTQQYNQWHEEWISYFHTLTPHAFFTKWYSQPLFSSLSSTLLEKLIQERSQYTPRDFLAQFLEMSLVNQPSVTLDRIALIYGKKDRKYSEMYRNFSSLAIGIESAGHICHIEDPEACARALRRHLHALL